MGVNDFLDFVRYVARGAIAPQLTPDGALSDDYSTLQPLFENLNAVVIEAMHRLHATASRLHADDSLELFFQRFMFDLLSEANAPQRVSTIVLLFDSGHHPMKGCKYEGTKPRAQPLRAPRPPPPPTFTSKWIDDREARANMFKEFRTWLHHNVSVRAGLNLVVHGLYAEPVVFWRDEYDNRRLSTPIERNLVSPDTRWPTTCYEADDLVLLWVKALLYPVDGNAAYNIMVVANDSDILLDLLIHASIIMALPTEKQPRLDGNVPVCLFATECLAGREASAPPGATDAQIRAPEYVHIFPAADILSATFTPALMRIAPPSASFNATTVLALAALWLCNHHDYMKATWMPICANVHVWFPHILQAIVAGDVGNVLEVRFSGDPGVWTPVEVRVSATGLRDMIKAGERHKLQVEHNEKAEELRNTVEMVDKSGMSSVNARERLEKHMRDKPTPKDHHEDVFHGQAARLALWLAKRLNNHLPGWRGGKGLPSEVETEAAASRWGYTMKHEIQLHNQMSTDAAGTLAIPDTPPVCMATDRVLRRAFYSVAN